MFLIGRVTMTQIKVVPKSGSYFSNYDKIFGAKDKPLETFIRPNCRVLVNGALKECQLLMIKEGEAFVKTEASSEIIISAKCIVEYLPST